MIANRADGFTLLELLVVMALMGLVTMMLSGGLRFGIRAWERQELQAGQTIETTTVARFLCDTIEEGRVQGGSASRLDVLGRLDTPFRRSGTLEIQLASDAAGRAEASWQPRSSLSAFASDRHADRLSESASLSFAYLQIEKTGEPVWRDHWQEGGTELLLVRVMLTPLGDPAHPSFTEFCHPRIRAAASEEAKPK
jgi:general secretion pathway protein J